MATPATPSAPPSQLTHGPVGPILLRLGVPMVLGVFFLMAVNFVDTYFVGLLGVQPLAAMSFTFPVISIILGLTMGLGVGATSAISRAIGAGDTSHVKQLTTHALLLAVLVVTIISALGLLFQRPIFLMLGASPKLLPLIEEYMTLWFIGVVFLVVPIVGNGAIRATGDARSPMLMMLMVAIVNGILDPLFIFGAGPIPALGLRGAAIATLIARALSFVLGLYIMGVRLKLLEWPTFNFKEIWGSWKQILSVGLPSALTNLLAPLASAAVTTMIAQHGSTAMAAYGLGGRIEGLLLIVPMVMGGALSPFIGQNWGAHLPHRVVQGVRQATVVAVAWGLGAWLLVELTAPWMGVGMSKDPAVQESFVLYLRVMSAGYAVHGIVSIVSASFNAMDHAIRSTVLSASQGLLFAVPFAIVGDKIWGLGGIFGGLVAAKYLTALIASRWLKTMFTPDDLALAKMSNDTKTALHAIESYNPELATQVEQLVSEVGHWDDFAVGTARRNTLSFRVKEREIAHLHPDGRLDLPFPPALRDELLRAREVEHHEQHHNSCWVTRKVENKTDLERARWLLRIGQVLYLCYTQGWDAAATQEKRQELALTPKLEEILQQVTAQCQRSKAEA
ncbi:MAG: MATE family efflux transporter [Deltaproteobacteria bacterium]|nr:MAG: MATE family efflux transporter [Deltaproteobacteria bacterium]